MAASVNAPVKDLLGHSELLGKLDLPKFKSEQCGELTLLDIVSALKTPGREARGEYVKPEFNPDVREVADLKEGMVLSGVVTNLTAFGAFVDIGVHQDGLVHISAITRKFIRDASEVLHVGQSVKAKVLSVDGERKRISLSMKELEPPPPPREVRRPAAKPAARPPRPARAPRAAARTAAPAPARAPAPSAAAATSEAPQAGAAAPAAAAAPPAPAAAAAAAVPPPVGDRGGARRFRDKREGGERSGGPRKPGEGGRAGQPRERRAPAKPVEPGKPDYSKFFVRGKRKERERGRGSGRDSEGASREEVRQALRKQEAGGTTLGDLLRKAGVKTDENK
jgi:predicted RNA-binding protein with RPS1 domain